MFLNSRTIIDHIWVHNMTRALRKSLATSFKHAFQRCDTFFECVKVSNHSSHIPPDTDEERTPTPWQAMSVERSAR